MSWLNFYVHSQLEVFTLSGNVCGSTDSLYSLLHLNLTVLSANIQDIYYTETFTCNFNILFVISPLNDSCQQCPFVFVMRLVLESIWEQGYLPIHGYYFFSARAAGNSSSPPLPSLSIPAVSGPPRSGCDQLRAVHGHLHLAATCCQNLPSCAHTSLFKKLIILAENLYHLSYQLGRNSHGLQCHRKSVVSCFKWHHCKGRCLQMGKAEAAL